MNGKKSVIDLDIAKIEHAHLNCCTCLLNDCLGICSCLLGECLSVKPFFFTVLFFIVSDIVENDEPEKI